MTQQDLFLHDAPRDTVSSLTYSPTIPHLLLASSWDKTVRLYDTTLNKLKSKYSHEAPVLAACLSADSKCYSGGLDQQVFQYDPSSSTSTSLATHADAVSAMCFSESRNLLISGSWDKSLLSIDPRSSTPAVARHELPQKVYSMSVGLEMLVVAMSERVVHIYDVRNMKEPYQMRETSLKFQTRTVATFPTGDGFVVSSIEGRVAVEYIDPSAEQQAKKYAFKCHRSNVDGIDTVYPVHALAFHPFGTFASGGGDGTVNIWDGASKKRLRQYPKYQTSISALCFNADGSQLAIAASYAYEQGDKPHPEDAIYIKSVVDAEVRPKSMQ